MAQDTTAYAVGDRIIVRLPSYAGQTGTVTEILGRRYLQVQLDGTGIELGLIPAHGHLCKLGQDWSIMPDVCSATALQFKSVSAI